MKVEVERDARFPGIRRKEKKENLPFSVSAVWTLEANETTQKWFLYDPNDRWPILEAWRFYRKDLKHVMYTLY